MDEIIQTMEQVSFAGNSLWRFAGLFLTLLTALIIGRALKYILQKTIDRKKNNTQPILMATMQALSNASMLIAFVIGLKIGMMFIVLNPTLAGIAATITTVLIWVSIGFAAYCMVGIIDEWLNSLAHQTESKLDDMLVPMVRKSLKVTIVIMVLVQIAQVLSDKPITSIIAGLGVGGIAIAMASQDTIKNFFGSIVIFADKPFEVGDRVVIDGHDGPVEEVGFRSTKIRTLNGHLVTVPNGELANKTIQNIGKRPYIKRVTHITVTYDTPPDKLEQGISILKEILHDHEGSHPDFPPRVYFTDFNDYSLGIMVIYWYHPPNYWDYCAFNEKVNMEILRRFNDEGIDFAFPTQTAYLAGDPNRPLVIHSKSDTDPVS